MRVAADSKKSSIANGACGRGLGRRRLMGGRKGGIDAHGREEGREGGRQTFRAAQNVHAPASTTTSSWCLTTFRRLCRTHCPLKFKMCGLVEVPGRGRGGWSKIRN